MKTPLEMLLTKVIGEPYKTGEHGQSFFVCPCCEAKESKFGTLPDVPNEKHRFKCWRCEFWGDIDDAMRPRFPDSRIEELFGKDATSDRPDKSGGKPSDESNSDFSLAVGCGSSSKPTPAERQEEADERAWSAICEWFGVMKTIHLKESLGEEPIHLESAVRGVYWLLLSAGEHKANVYDMFIPIIEEWEKFKKGELSQLTPEKDIDKRLVVHPDLERFYDLLRAVEDCNREVA